MEDKEEYYTNVVKYNPKYRDYNGVYLLDEWSSYSDIGKVFNGKVFKEEEYLLVENQYIDAIKVFLEFHDCYHLFVEEEIERYGGDIVDLDDPSKKLYEQVKQGQVYNRSDLDTLIRLILREYLWTELSSKKLEIKVGFYSDYYMWFLSKKDYFEIENVINGLSLYFY